MVPWRTARRCASLNDAVREPEPSRRGSGAQVLESPHEKFAQIERRVQLLQRLFKPALPRTSLARAEEVEHLRDRGNQSSVVVRCVRKAGSVAVVRKVVDEQIEIDSAEVHLLPNHKKNFRACSTVAS